MEDRAIQLQLGIGAMIAAMFLLFVAIPSWVSSPSNVPNIILSPVFWPNVLAGVVGIVGAGMVLTSYWRQKPAQPIPSDVADRRAAFARLGAVAAMMAATMLLLATLGLVWTAMLVFVSLAFLVRTSHPKTAVVCAVIVPLVLYGFFAHVAGVAIPQGNYVRLP